MKKIGIGILGCADIAYRRFMPALMKVTEFEYVGVASRDIKNTNRFIDNYGGKGYGSYTELLEDTSIQVVYIPLPPALHYTWAKKALLKGKHVLLEKPFCTTLDESKELLNLAKEKQLTIFENYMFQYHNQFDQINKIINDNIVGDIKLIRSNFAFPLRESNDFRYNKKLGGGALLDAGGYITKLATLVLGDSIELCSALSNTLERYEVDMYGTITFNNRDGVIFQGAYGFDSYYQCNLEFIGNKGRVWTNRIFTAPPGFVPKLFIEMDNGITEIQLSEDDHFYKTLLHFEKAISSMELREKMYIELEIQARLMERIQIEQEKKYD